jgi:preprotein translocase SecE subunit
MFRFIRESIKEFDHVVFPTRQETKTYFTVVVTVIVVMMVYVFAISSLLSEGFRAIRPLTATNASFDPSSLIDSGSGLNTLSGASLSGVTASGAGLSGATITPDVSTGSGSPASLSGALAPAATGSTTTNP